MENDLIIKAKELMINSSIGQYIGEEKIDEALKYVCESQDEMYDLYKEKTGIEYDGYLAGFNNAGVSYFCNDSEPHAVIHEILHTLSSTFNSNGNRIKNGIANKNKGFENQLNEGLTEFLTYKTTGNYTNMYKEGKGLFRGIEKSFNEYFEDENALLKIYFENDSNSLEQFINKTLPKKSIIKFIKNNSNKDSVKSKIDEVKNIESFEYIYNNLLFLKVEQITSLTEIINKETNKIIKDRKLEKNHPFIFKIKNKILGNKEDKLMLPEYNEDNKSMKNEVSKLSKTIDESVQERTKNVIEENIDYKEIDDGKELI